MQCLAPRLAFLIAVAAALLVAPGFVPQTASAQQVTPAIQEESNDDRVPVALGTLGAIAVVGIAAGIGYLYRRQIGLVGHYEDGFTPRDPRDHPTH